MKNSLIKNSIFNFIYKFFEVLFPVVTAVYVSRVLLAEGVGRVTYAQTIVTYFVTFAALGLPNYGVKAIATCRKSKKETRKVFSELFLINVCSTLVCTIVYYAFIFNFGAFNEDGVLYAIMGLILISNILNVDWLYQGVEDYRFIAVRSMVIKIVTLIPLFIFVKDSTDTIEYAFIIAVTYMVTQAVNLIYIIKNIGFDFKGIQVRRHLKPVMILLASSVATEVYILLDSTMLGVIHGDVYVGYYSNSTKLIRMLFGMITAFSATIYPRISEYLSREEVNKAKELVSIGLNATLYLAIPSSIGVFVGADYITLALFGESFESSIGTTRILSILVVVFSFAYIKGHVVLLAAGKEKAILKATIVGAISNFVINLVLIPPYKHNGAAIASVVAEVLVTSVLLIETRRLLGKDRCDDTLLFIVKASIVLAVFTCVTKMLLDMLSINIVIKMILLVASSVMFYFATTKRKMIDLFSMVK